MSYIKNLHITPEFIFFPPRCEIVNTIISEQLETRKRLADPHVTYRGSWAAGLTSLFAWGKIGWPSALYVSLFSAIERGHGVPERIFVVISHLKIVSGVNFKPFMEVVTECT